MEAVLPERSGNFNNRRYCYIGTLNIMSVALKLANSAVRMVIMKRKTKITIQALFCKAPMTFVNRFVKKEDLDFPPKTAKMNCRPFH